MARKWLCQAGRAAAVNAAYLLVGAWNRLAIDAILRLCVALCTDQRVTLRQPILTSELRQAGRRLGFAPKASYRGCARQSILHEQGTI